MLTDLGALKETKENFKQATENVDRSKILESVEQEQIQKYNFFFMKWQNQKPKIMQK